MQVMARLHDVQCRGVWSPSAATRVAAHRRGCTAGRSGNARTTASPSYIGRHSISWRLHGAADDEVSAAFAAELRARSVSDASAAEAAAAQAFDGQALLDLLRQKYARSYDVSLVSRWARYGVDRAPLPSLSHREAGVGWGSCLGRTLGGSQPAPAASPGVRGGARRRGRVKWGTGGSTDVCGCAAEWLGGGAADHLQGRPVCRLCRTYMGRQFVALNIMWKYAEQKGFGLTPEEHLARLEYCAAVSAVAAGRDGTRGGQ